jgi:TRAP-type C4-dicarboxylate transport system permease small subunit
MSQPWERLTSREEGGGAVAADQPLLQRLQGMLTSMNARLSRWALYLACACLAGLLSVVVYGVVLRYVFNAAPPYVEQVALLLIISVAMFGAAAGVRDAGHIGLDSLVAILPERAQFWCRFFVHLMAIAFAGALVAGGIEMGVSTRNSSIPTLGISEAFRYLPVLVAGILIALFAIEHIIAQFTGRKITPSWH